MAKWETDNVKSDFDANKEIETLANTRNSARNGSTATGAPSSMSFEDVTSATGWDTNTYSVVGINVEGVDGMREAIRAWVVRIENHLSAIEPSASAAQAFKSHDGQVEEAVRLYIENSKQYCMNLASSLLAFSDKLADAKNAWIQSTGNLAGTITSDTQATDPGTRYTEKIQ